ncbi:hypothetical protein [Staphylococcus caeli]|uniref:hypothetical protein n=1 Tax=Staphylococcus caeli TaxID=2201815 RepID=UPI003F563915
MPALIYALLFAVQYFLSRSGNKLLGAIVPIIFVCILIFLYLTGKLGLNLWGTLIFGIIGLLFLLAEWDKAQKDKQEQR